MTQDMLGCVWSLLKVTEQFAAKDAKIGELFVQFVPAFMRGVVPLTSADSMKTRAAAFQLLRQLVSVRVTPRVAASADVAAPFVGYLLAGVELSLSAKKPKETNANLKIEVLAFLHAALLSHSVKKKREREREKAI